MWKKIQDADQCVVFEQNIVLKQIAVNEPLGQVAALKFLIAINGGIQAGGF